MSKIRTKQEKGGECYCQETFYIIINSNTSFYNRDTNHINIRLKDFINFGMSLLGYV